MIFGAPSASSAFHHGVRLEIAETSARSPLDFATASTEFRRPGQVRSGRQQQSWVRFPEGWRIVAAHVSFSAAEDKNNYRVRN